MDLGVIRWSGVDWIGLTRDREKWRGLVIRLGSLTPRRTGLLTVGRNLTSASNAKPVWRWVRIPPPQSLKVLSGDKKGTQSQMRL
jgi:hypothetical protein